MPAKNLGQVEGSGATVAIYTVPTGKTAVASSVVFLNTTDAPVEIVVRLALGGAANATKQVLLNTTLAARGRISVAEGWTASAGDVFRVYAPTGVAINLSGTES